MPTRRQEIRRKPNNLSTISTFAAATGATAIKSTAGEPSAWKASTRKATARKSTLTAHPLTHPLFEEAADRIAALIGTSGW